MTKKKKKISRGQKVRTKARKFLSHTVGKKIERREKNVLRTWNHDNHEYEGTPKSRR